jgi:LmbE family N-acetylglucosaminyl deacetylase
VSHPGATRPCLVTFHAHPDDEAIFTGGTVAMAVAAGWRVVLVVATAGEAGARPSWLRQDLARIRRSETLASARLLGIDRVEFLGYEDSGADDDRRPASTDDPSADNDAAGATVTLDAAPLDDAVARLRRILFDERACALTSYDAIGIYGHRDHVRVHQIAAAAVLATGCDLVEATVSRARLTHFRHELLRRGLEPSSWPAAVADSIGTGADPRLVSVDVSAQQAVKRAAVAAHASQVVEASSFMGLPPGVFHRLLDVEWFVPTRTVDGRLAALLATACLGRPRNAQLQPRRSKNAVLT